MCTKDIKIKILFSGLLSLLINGLMFAQQGKDGNASISSSSVVNVYTSLPPTTNVAAGSSVIPVVNSTGFAPGDLIYIIQVQGATVNCFPEAINPNNSQPSDFTYGTITAYNNSGNNEFAQVFSVTGNTINIDCSLQNNYTGAGKVQVIRVPRYNSLTINSGGTVTCPAWNGTTGGVIAIEVLGNTIINSGGAINASALGFRGGMVTAKTISSFGGGAWGHMNKNEGACKGESIVGDTTLYGIVFAGKFGKGAVANGGGGGSTVNGGGGGGANGGVATSYTNGFGVPNISLAGYVTAWNLEAAGLATVVSSGGGRGGYTFSQSNSNPTVTAPGNGAWSADNRRVQGGLGGRPLDYSSGRIFIGGGGGAGDHDNNYGGRGGHGGGIINIISYGNISGAGLIVANGENGANSNTTGNPPLNNCNGRDAAGGGGGGGAIKIKCLGSITTVTLSANGGNGGNQQMKSGHITGSATMAYGPGGGGGGGVIVTTPAAVTNSVLGGTNGIVQYISGTETCLIDNHFPPNGATSGGVGTTATTLIPEYTLSVTNASICTNAVASLTATSNNPSASFFWFSNNTGATQLGTGAVFTTSTITTPGTYTVYVGMCNGNYRIPALITVTNGPTLAVNSPTICSGQTTTLTVSGASTYTWSTGSNSTSIVQTPTATVVFTVTGSNGACLANTTSTINVLNNPTVAVNSGTICSGGSVTLTASGAGTYSWNTGPTSASIAVSPTTTTIYTVTGTSGICSNAVTATVNIVSTPTVAVNSTTLCNGGSATLTASGAATYSWNTGPTTASIAVSPTSTTIYTVTGTAGPGCVDTETASVIVFNTPSLSLNANTFNICGAQIATVIATASSGTYSWSTGATTSVITTAIAGVYNVTVTNQCGTAVQSATVIVGSGPTFSIVPSASLICNNGTVTLNTSGSTGTVNWSTGANNTPTINVNTSGVYTATLTNPCGSAVYSISLGEGPGTFFNIAASSNTICSGGSVTLTASGTGTFDWSTGATNTTAITVTNTGIYTATITNECGNGISTFSVLNGPAPSISLTSGNFCSGETATITASGTASTYSWSTGLSSPIFTTTTAGIYSVVGTNSCGATTETINVAFLIAPTVSVSSNVNLICPGESATLTASGNQSSATYTWSSSTNTTNVEVVSAGGIYTVSNANICGLADATISIVQSTLNPDFIFSPSGGIAPVSINFTNTSVNNSSNLWNFGNGTNGTAANGNANYTSAGIYTVTLVIQNADGCFATVTRTIEITESGLGIIPELITPNGDGKNETFEVKGIERYPNSNLEIYNRWGNLVYSKSNYDNSWDGSANFKGTSKGKLPVGTYYFILNLNDSEGKSFKGFVQLQY